MNAQTFDNPTKWGLAEGEASPAVTAQARADQLQDLALALADAEARERKRLAQLLHDHFQQLLSAAKLRAGMVRRTAKEKVVIDHAQHLERLLEEAIAASHSLTLELSPPVLYDAGLNAAVRGLVRNLEQRNEIKFSVEMDDHAEPALEQIRVLLFEAIRELLHNVLRHAKASNISIQSQILPQGRIEIAVCDNGSGFDASTLSVRPDRKALKTFGLLEIRERLRFIGGDVGITSQIGVGTQVHLLVPAELRPVEEVGPLPVEASSTAQRNRPPRTSGGILRVMVADDHAIFREGLTSLLANESCLKVVGIAADGQQTLTTARELRPDVLLLDVTMPIMNGVEVASILSREMPDLRIIGLSMHKTQDMADAMRNAGAVAYFTKGGSSEALLDMLRSLC